MAAKVTKTTANYRHPSPTRDHCRDCSMWRPPEKCTAVGGHIWPDGVCDLFKRAAKARPAIIGPTSMDEFKHGFAVEMEEKAVVENNDCWTFSGYASTFGNKDLGGDIVCQGAFQDSLKRYGLPLLLFQHKADECPVGVVTDAKENSRGLWIKGEMPKDDAFCRDRLVPQLKKRSLKGLSIGYRAIEHERRKSDNVRLLKRIRLFEISFVSMPMNEEANVEHIKNMATDELVNLLEDATSAARALTYAASSDPVKELVSQMNYFSALIDEVKNDRPQLRDSIRAAENALESGRRQQSKIAGIANRRGGR
jgi:uncharacterized protein